MFFEHLFECKRLHGTATYQRRLSLALCLLLLAMACVPSAQRLQAVRLAGQLADAHQALTRDATAAARPCADARDVSIRLHGEPGLTGLGDGWVALRQAADALVAACGQLQLLSLPAADTLPVQDARIRWQQGVTRELRLACTALGAAAAALATARPECT